MQRSPGTPVRRAALLAVAGLALAGCASHAPTAAATSERATAADAWTGSWGAAPVGADARYPSGFAGRSVRSVVHLSVGGTAVRVHLSNAFGTAPLALVSATVAVQATSGPAAAKYRTLHRLTFGGRADPVVPAGAEAVSDAVPLAVPAGANLLVTTYLARGGAPTYHWASQQLTYLARGNHTADTSPRAYTATVPSWYYVDEVDVAGPARGTVVALGDSITDGFHSTIGANRRWPDVLAARLRAGRGSAAPGVLDEGISGNRVLLAAARSGIGGPAATARVQRDVLSRTGVRSVVLLEGINDIDDTPQQTDVTRIENGLQQIAAQVHAAGKRIFIGTLTPYEGCAAYTAARDAERIALNTWIRRSTAFDGVIDFERAVRDPDDPDRLLPAYDSGDHLHPDDAGYRAMADAVALARL